MKGFITIFISLSLLNGCSKSDYLYVQPVKPPPKISQEDHAVKSYLAGQIDILWVIDNSGSMGKHQNNVIANAELFINEFVKKSKVHWRMGLISSTLHQSPFLGFKNVFEADSSKTVETFQAGVKALGLNGSGNEQLFAPVLYTLKTFPTFLRKDTPLALISITDAPEQSSISANQFLSELAKHIPITQVTSYVILAAEDFGCEATDDRFDYKGSPYETLVTRTNGKAYKLCSSDFSKHLVDIGADIVGKAVTNPRIFLNVRPIPETIRVTYKGNDIPGGFKEDGGFWVYDLDLNAVLFHDLSFAPGDTEGIEVTFKEAPTK